MIESAQTEAPSVLLHSDYWAVSMPSFIMEIFPLNFCASPNPMLFLRDLIISAILHTDFYSLDISNMQKKSRTA